MLARIALTLFPVFRSISISALHAGTGAGKSRLSESRGIRSGDRRMSNATFAGDVSRVWHVRKYRQKLVPRNYKLPVRRPGLPDIPHSREPGGDLPAGSLQCAEPSELQHSYWLNGWHTRRHNWRSWSLDVIHLWPGLNYIEPGKGLPGIGEVGILNRDRPVGGANWLCRRLSTKRQSCSAGMTIPAEQICLMARTLSSF